MNHAALVTKAADIDRLADAEAGEGTGFGTRAKAAECLRCYPDALAQNLDFLVTGIHPGDLADHFVADVYGTRNQSLPRACRFDLDHLPDPERAGIHTFTLEGHGLIRREIDLEPIHQNARKPSDRTDDASAADAAVGDRPGTANPAPPEPWPAVVRRAAAPASVRA